MPELSYGSHFFQDLVEEEIFYAALFCEKTDVLFNDKLLKKQKNQLLKLMPDAQKYSQTVFVYDTHKSNLMLLADVLTQKLVCYFKSSAAAGQQG